MSLTWLLVIVLGVIAIFATFITIIARYKTCPSDKILVIYGVVKKDKQGGTRSAKCIHGGATFVWPRFQKYRFLDLTPIQLDIDLRGALSRQNIRIDVPCSFTVGISTDPAVMTNAAERLLNLDHPQIKRLAEDIILGQLRVVIATMDIEEINADRDKFIENVSVSVEAELNKIGLKLINVNAKDIGDESGYIDALGKEAAAKAVNDAKKSVAERERDGDIGKARADKEKRVEVAAADATAVEGENTAKVTIANSDAERRVREAEAKKKGDAAEKIQAAQALEAAYSAEMAAEKARAERDAATQNADVVVPARIAKEKMEIDADAQAEKDRREARGEGDAEFHKLEGKARGIKEILSKQAEGLEEIVKAAGGNPDKAAMLMIVDKLPEIVKLQVEAIKGINIEKVIVWDSMSNDKPTTANFLSGMIKSVPPLNEIFKMAGMELPEFLGKQTADDGKQTATEEAPQTEEEDSK